MLTYSRPVLASMLAFCSMAGSLRAADVIVIDGGVVTVTGVPPAAAPGTAEVKMGAGQIRAGGAVTAQDMTVTRTSQATGAQVVRGDDARLSNARPANGGNAATVGGMQAAAFVPITQKGAPQGVATLDVNGKVPLGQIPDGIGGGGGGGANWPGIAGDGSSGQWTGSGSRELPGFYDFKVFSGTTNVVQNFNLPDLVIIRHKGNLTITGTVTVAHVANENRRLALTRQFNALSGNAGVYQDSGVSAKNSGGGGHLGQGGRSGAVGGLGGVTIPLIGETSNGWVSYRPMLGGSGGVHPGPAAGLTGLGGGSIYLLVEGDLDMTNGAIWAGGRNGWSDSSNGAGGGGGGSIVVICTGTLTGGSFDVRGGGGADGGDNNRRGGGGGGGLIALYAQHFAGTRSTSVEGGFATSPALPGNPGIVIVKPISSVDLRNLLSGR